MPRIADIELLTEPYIEWLSGGIDAEHGVGTETGLRTGSVADYVDDNAVGARSEARRSYVIGAGDEFGHGVGRINRFHLHPDLRKAEALQAREIAPEGETLGVGGAPFRSGSVADNLPFNIDISGDGAHSGRKQQCGGNFFHGKTIFRKNSQKNGNFGVHRD